MLRLFMNKLARQWNVFVAARFAEHRAQSDFVKLVWERAMCAYKQGKESVVVTPEEKEQGISVGIVKLLGKPLVVR